MSVNPHSPTLKRTVLLRLEDALRAERLRQELHALGFDARPIDATAPLREALADGAPSVVLAEPELLDDALPIEAPLIVLARNDTFATRLAAVRAGSRAFFAEPFETSALAARLARLCAAPDTAPIRVLLAGSKLASLTGVIAALDLPDIRLRHWSDPKAALAELAGGETALLLVADTRPTVEPAEFVELVRQHSGPALPVVLLAASGSADARQAGAGVDAVVDPEQLAQLPDLVRARVQRVSELRAAFAAGDPAAIAPAPTPALAEGAPTPGQPLACPADDAERVARIRAALADDQFRLVYQPISSLSGAPTAFYEVFLRMLDERGEDILPAEFVPVVDRHGLGPQLDRWVIGRALRVLEQQRSLRHAPILFVKVLAATVCDPSFPGWLRQQVAASELEPERLVLQITHRTAVAHPLETRELLRSLRAAGFRTALEHYAETDPSHPLLSELTLDFVKLSRQLTHDMTENRQHQQLVQAITGRCRALEIHSVAALVQDALTLSTLWSCGVEYIQGYFMQEPADVFDTAEQLA